jgi:hypothetical protein
VSKSKRKNKPPRVEKNYPRLLAALRNLRSTNAEGFEGLVRDCLEVVAARRLFLNKAGPQEGADAGSAYTPGLPIIRVEAKRFGASTDLSLDELKAKLAEALDEDEAGDVWALAFTKEMKNPDWRQLEQIAAKRGVTLACLDWREAAGALPALAALCAAGRAVVETRLGPDVASELDTIEQHPVYLQLRVELERSVSAPSVGWDLARDAASAWLIDTVSERGRSRRRLRSDAEVLADDAAFVARPTVSSGLDQWWNGNSAAPCALLGEEGRGKTWVALKWMLDRIDRDRPPLCIAISAKSLENAAPERALALALQPALPDTDLEVLERRVTRWVRSADAERRILFIVDGLNERWDFEWADFLARFDEAPWRGKVRVLLTARTAYWRDELMRLKALAEGGPVEVDVPDFTDAERNAFLAAHGLDPKGLKRSLLELVKVPRFAALAVKLKAEVEHVDDLSPARLVLQDWRKRRESNPDLKLDDDGLIAFVAALGRQVVADDKFRMSAKEVGARLGKASGRDQNYYQRTIDELISGHWLRSEGAPFVYKLNEDMLPYAIGLDLSLELETIIDTARAAAIITDYQEQLRGADYAARILGAATTITLLRNRATSVARRALVSAWISAQNFSPADFEDVWTILPCDAALFFEIADELFTTSPVRREEGETLIKSFANAFQWTRVRELLIERLPDWVGGYGEAPLRWHLRQAAGRGRALGAEHIERTKSNRDQWRAVEAKYGRDVDKRLATRERDFRADAALSIISYLPRAPFIEVFVTWAVGHALMEFYDGREAFDWVIRRNLIDDEEARAAFLEEIARLKALGGAVAINAASVLEEALSLKPKVRRTHQEAPTLQADGLVVWDEAETGQLPDKAIAQRLSQFATDPAAHLPPHLLKVVKRRAAAPPDPIGIEDVADVGRETLAEYRWAPAETAAALKRDLRASAKHGVPPADIERFAILMDGPEHEAIRAYSRSAPAVPSDAQGYQGEIFRRRSAAVMAVLDKGPREQLAAIEASEGPLGVSIGVVDLMERLGDDELRIVCERLRSSDRGVVLSWLRFLNAVDFAPPLPQEADILLDLAKQEDDEVRTAAIRAILTSQDDRLGKAFFASPWAYTEGGKGNDAIPATYLLIEYGAQAPFADMRKRIVPQALAYLVEKRGLQSDEVEFLREVTRKTFGDHASGRLKGGRSYAHQFQANAAWDAVLERDDGEIVALVQRLIESGHLAGFFDHLDLISVIRAIMRRSPDVAVELWASAKTKLRHASVAIGDVDALPFSEGNDSPAKAQARRVALEECKADSILAELVSACYRGGHEAWLIAHVRSLVSLPSLARQALGLTLAGFLSADKAANDLWKEIAKLDLVGWIGDVRASAKARYVENARSIHWYVQFAQAKTAPDAFALLELYIACMDARNARLERAYIKAHHSEMPQPWRRHLDANKTKRNNAIRKRTEAQRQTLYATKQVSFIWPWF